MKKKKEKGFMLVETLIVSLFILGALIFLFVQFRDVNQNYQTAFQYNRVDALYAAENMKKFYLQDNYENMLIKYLEKANPYMILTDCPSEYISEVSYCKDLKEALKIKSILFTYVDTVRIVGALDETEEIEPSLKRFIRSIKNDDKSSNKYRLIVEMENGTFATIKIY